MLYRRLNFAGRPRPPPPQHVPQRWAGRDPSTPHNGPGGWVRGPVEGLGKGCGKASGWAGGSKAVGRVARRAHVSAVRCCFGRLRRPWPPVVDGDGRSADILPPRSAKSGRRGDKFVRVGRNPVTAMTILDALGEIRTWWGQPSPTLGEIRSRWGQISPTLGEIRHEGDKFRPRRAKSGHGRPNFARKKKEDMKRPQFLRFPK